MKKILTKEIWWYMIVMFLTAITFLPSVSFAQQELNSGLKNPIGPSNITALVNSILNVVVTVGTVLVVLAIIYSGFLFISARGNPEKIKEAKSIFLWTIVGTIVLLGAQALSQIIVNTAKDVGVTGL